MFKAKQCYSVKCGCAHWVSLCSSFLCEDCDLKVCSYCSRCRLHHKRSAREASSWICAVFTPTPGPHPLTTGPSGHVEASRLQGCYPAALSPSTFPGWGVWLWGWSKSSHLSWAPLLPFSSTWLSWEPCSLLASSCLHSAWKKTAAVWGRTLPSGPALSQCLHISGEVTEPPSPLRGFLA